MAEVEVKKVILKNLAGEYLVPYTIPYTAADGIKIEDNVIAVTGGNLTDGGTLGIQLIEFYQNGSSGYMLYSDKTLIQWAQQDTTNTVVQLLKEYANTNYALLIPGFFITGIGRQFTNSKTTTTFRTRSDVRDCGGSSWMTIGKGV